MHRAMRGVICATVTLIATSAAAQKKGDRYKCPLDKPQKVYGHALNASARLEVDETWTPNNVYLVIGPFHVMKKLTLQAGTVVCFDYGPAGADGSAEPPPGGMSIEEKATLKVLGTADNRVVFTQAGDRKQYWGGLYFASGSNTEDSTMQYLDVYNAGLSAASGVLNTFPDPEQPPLDMQHVTYYSVQRVGLKNLTAGFTPESRILVHNYAEETPKRDLFNYPVLRVHLYGAHTVTKDTMRLGDTVPEPPRVVQLDHAEGMHIDKSVTLHPLSDNLRWRNIQNMKLNGYPDDPPVFTLKAGVVLAVNNGGYIYVGNGGTGMANLVAAGTKEAPVTFTSDAFHSGKEPEPGDWPGIEFSPGNFKAKVSKFEHVVFEYGGGMGRDTIYNCNDGRGDRSAMILFTISSNGADYDGPPIRNSVFRHSAAAGVRSRCNVNHGGGCLSTNYEDPALGNTFEGFLPPDRPATTPLNCPSGDW